MVASAAHPGRASTTRRRPAALLNLVGGLATVVLGVLVLLWPDTSLVVVAVLFGIQLLGLGLLRVLDAIRGSALPRALRVVRLLAGALTALVGVICIFRPFTSLQVLVLLTAAGWLLDGTANLVVGGNEPKGTAGKAYLVVGGASIVGALVLLVWPELTLLTLVILAGWMLIAFGIVQVVASLRQVRVVSGGSTLSYG